MLAVALALGIQVVWYVVRAGLELGGLSVRDVHVFALAIALATAVELVIAASAASLARRLEGRRRWSMALAALAYLAMAAMTVLYRGLLHGWSSSPAAYAWITGIRLHGWCVLEAIGITGFAIAAGGRALWLGPLAVGCTLVTEDLTVLGGTWHQAEVIGFVVVKAVLVVLLVAGAERGAPADAPDRERARGGLRRAELATWITAGLTGFWAAPALLVSSVHLSCALGFVVVASNALLAVAAWSIARGMGPGPSRWPWYAVATCALWMLAWPLGSWIGTLIWHWGRLEAVHLHAVGWWYRVPSTLADLFAMAALAGSGLHRRSHAVTVTAMIGGVAVAASLAGWIALPGHATVLAAGELVASLALVRAFRTARAALTEELPRASVRRTG